jgi:hypothetical protein
MHVNTDQFAAITGRVEQLETELAALKPTLPVLIAFYRAGHADGAESILGRAASPPRPRPRHLQAVPGGTS